MKVTDAECQPTKAKTPNPKTRKKKNYIHWRSNKFNQPDTTFSGKFQDDLNITDAKTYFSKYICNEFIDQMADFNNIYSVKQFSASVNTSGGEIRHLLALHIIMGIIPYPILQLFWNPSTTLPLIEDIGISRNRFEKLHNCLHVWI